MSGGHFDYKQYVIRDMADSIEEYLMGRDLEPDDVESILRDHWTDQEEKDYVKKHHRTVPNYMEYNKETIKEIKKGMDLLRKAYVYAQRIDWLRSCDDGEESFHKRLKEDLEELKQRKK